jgi:hypothetical protein
MVVKGNGNVGIGTNTPDVFSRSYSGRTVGITSASGESALMINSSGTNVVAFEMGRGGSRSTLLYDTTTSTDFGSLTSKPLRLLTNGTPIATFGITGNLGIGTDGEPMRLAMAGTIADSTYPLIKGTVRAPYVGGWNTLAPETTIGGYQLFTYRSDNGEINKSSAVEVYLVNNSFGAGLTAMRFITGGYNSQNGYEAMRINEFQNVGIGTNNPTARLAVELTNATAYANTAPSIANCTASFSNTSGHTSGGTFVGYQFNISGNSQNRIGYIGAITDSTGNQALSLVFGTNTAAGDRSEKMRLDSAGNLLVGTTSSSAKVSVLQSANSVGLEVTATDASYSSSVIDLQASRNTTNTSYYFFSASISGIQTKIRIADSGNVTNVNGSYGTISDAKLKTDIVDAGSQWADIKAVKFRKFKMIDDPDQRVQLGVIAQEIEQVSAGLIEEHTDRDADDNDLGTTTKSVKTSVLLMKAAVALQEAMIRIEQLEARLDAANL